MARLSFEEINDQLDMEFFLERESLDYKVGRGSSGEQLNIRCCPVPECRDTRWRTYFGTETGRGNCFVCNARFTKVSFIHAHLEHDKEWAATARYCEELLREQGWRPKRTTMVAVDPGEVKLPTSDPLPLEDGSNLAYLEQRGFDAAIARYFGLRFCEFGWWRYLDAEGKQQTQNFGNRIIIPVYDLDGVLKTFQGRDLSGTSTMKYLFPKELPGTGRYLLNGHNVVACNHVVMGEGAFDVAAIKLAYDADQALRDIVPVGSFGKHLSYGSPTGDDQLGRFLALKKRGVKTVTIMWDGEEKALTAALDAAKLLTAQGFVVRIALLPFEKDPNEVLGEVVRRAHYAAVVWTPAVDIKWRLRNPYSAKERHKLAA